VLNQIKTLHLLLESAHLKKALALCQNKVKLLQKYVTNEHFVSLKEHFKKTFFTIAP
jgi:hypothetical protein